MSTSSSHQPETDVQPARPRTATGFSTFAGVVMVIAGIWHVLQGIAAIAHDHIYVSTPNYLYSFGNWSRHRDVITCLRAAKVGPRRA